MLPLMPLIIMLDLDDTLIMRDPQTKISHISSENVQVLKEIAQKKPNTIIGIATGRDQTRINQFLSELSFLIKPVPVVALNGDLVYLYHGPNVPPEVIYEKYFNSSEVKAVVTAAIAANTEICGFNYEDISNLLATHLDGLMTNALFDMIHCRSKSLFNFEQKQRVWKFKIALRPDVAAKFLQQFYEQGLSIYPFAKQARLYGAKEIWYEVNPPHTSKAAGVKEVLKYFQLTNDDLLAIGDGANDYELLSIAKYGYLICEQSYKIEAYPDCFNFFVSKEPKNAVARILSAFL